MICKVCDKKIEAINSKIVNISMFEHNEKGLGGNRGHTILYIHPECFEAVAGDGFMPQKTDKHIAYTTEKDLILRVPTYTPPIQPFSVSIPPADKAMREPLTENPKNWAPRKEPPKIRMDSLTLYGITLMAIFYLFVAAC